MSATASILTRQQAEAYLSASRAAQAFGGHVLQETGSASEAVCTRAFPLAGGHRVARLAYHTMVDSEDYRTLDEFAEAYGLT